MVRLLGDSKHRWNYGFWTTYPQANHLGAKCRPMARQKPDAGAVAAGFEYNGRAKADVGARHEPAHDPGAGSNPTSATSSNPTTEREAASVATLIWSKA